MATYLGTLVNDIFGIVEFKMYDVESPQSK